ncbi:MAG TPA: hypothetical protein VGS80_08125, partial [Ktedonobacterales bacterium]|nr:hypothetical protein [Ktedonobacterales bacterium]
MTTTPTLTPMPAPTPTWTPTPQHTPAPVRAAIRGWTVTDTAARDRRRPDRAAKRTARAAKRRTLKRPEEGLLDSLTPILGPRPWHRLVFDWETRPDAHQTPRVAYFELRGISTNRATERHYAGRLVPGDNSTLHRAGFVLAAGEWWPGDDARVRDFADRHSHRGHWQGVELAVLTVPQFVRRLYAWCCAGKCPGWRARRREYARVLGFNLWFDLSRTFLVGAWGAAARDFAGGVWGQPDCGCDPKYLGTRGDCKLHPPIRSVKYGRHKRKYAFRGTARRGKSVLHRGSFTDAQQLGLALRKCEDASLAGMCGAWGLDAGKDAPPDYAGPDDVRYLGWPRPLEGEPGAGVYCGPIDVDYLWYLVHDVWRTDDLYQAEVADWRLHDLPARPEHLLSAASLAKNYDRKAGIPAGYAATWGMRHEDMGIVMGTFHGGRAECGVRLMPVRTIQLDATAEYPTVNHLMRLHEYPSAERVTTERGPEVVRRAQAILDDPDVLARCLTLELWPQLRIFVQLQPGGEDILPVRAAWGGVEYNEALPSVTAPRPLWWALPHVVASVLLTGHVPSVLDAIAFVPHGERPGLRAFPVMGRQDLICDPRTEPIWTTLVNARRALDSAAGGKTPQGGSLKEAASSGAYGIQLEIDVRTYGEVRHPVNVYHQDGVTRRTGNRIEEPGQYFAGPIASLIPAGGQLILAIIGRLLRDWGLHYATMDTDGAGAAIVYPSSLILPPNVDRQFRDAVYDVQRQLDGLLVFRDTPHFLKLELGEGEALYTVAISAKRYAQFALVEVAEGTPGAVAIAGGWYIIVFRKISAHATGQLGRRAQDYDLAYARQLGIPEKPKDLGVPTWMYVPWYLCVRALLTGRYPDGSPLHRMPDGTPVYVPQRSGDPFLSEPSFTQKTIDNASDLRRFRKVGARPGDFVTV